MRCLRWLYQKSYFISNTKISFQITIIDILKDINPYHLCNELVEWMNNLMSLFIIKELKYFVNCSKDQNYRNFEFSITKGMNWYTFLHHQKDLTYIFSYEGIIILFYLLPGKQFLYAKIAFSRCIQSGKYPPQWTVLMYGPSVPLRKFLFFYF